MARKSPSFDGFEPASETSSKSKRANKRRDTEHELLLRQVLWHKGLRYRKHVADLPGKPDIVFPGVRVVVFCDGDFWHGRDWPDLREKLSQRSNPDYWIAKIEYNRERDKKNNELLEKEGWYVIRVWETDIKKDPKAVAEQINSMLERLSAQQ